MVIVNEAHLGRRGSGMGVRSWGARWVHLVLMGCMRVVAGELQGGGNRSFATMQPLRKLELGCKRRKEALRCPAAIAVKSHRVWPYSCTHGRHHVDLDESVPQPAAYRTRADTELCTEQTSKD